MLDKNCLVREFDKNVVELFNSQEKRWNYYVLYSDLKTRRGLIRAIYYLSQKPWITPEHIKQLLELSHKKIGHSITSVEKY
jgi:collagenase-like PrtC family protease